jgi:hypothetical protein
MTDTARFRVDRVDGDTGQTHLWLAGEVLRGGVRPGMVVTAGPVHRPSFREPIDAVQPAEDASVVALGFRWLDDADRERWRAMEWIGAVLDIPAAPLLHPCPCCGFRTLEEEERGGFEICGVCGWEDDLVQYRDPGYRGGANHESLDEAHAAFLAAHPHLAPTRDG